MQRVKITNNIGQKLDAVLHETGSPNVVVLCHGFRSSKESKIMVNLARSLEIYGITPLRFDFSGSGKSEGSFQYGNYLQEAEDLRSVIEYLNALNRTPVAVLGHGKGGDAVLLYASKYHDIGTVINVSGRYDLSQGIQAQLGENYMERIERDDYIKAWTGNYHVTKASLLERLSTNMHEACLSIGKKCRVLTVHGSEDETIPVKDAVEFSKIIPNHSLEIIEGADHRYSSHEKEFAHAVLRFIRDRDKS